MSKLTVQFSVFPPHRWPATSFFQPVLNTSPLWPWVSRLRQEVIQRHSRGSPGRILLFLTARTGSLVARPPTPAELAGRGILVDGTGFLHWVYPGGARRPVVL